MFWLVSVAFVMLVIKNDLKTLIQNTREASFLMYLIVFIIWHTCIYLEYEHKCRCLWRPEEGIRVNATAITSGCELPNIGYSKKSTHVQCSTLDLSLQLRYFLFLIVLASIGSVG